MTEAGVTRTSDSRTTRATRRDIGDSSFIGGDGTSREMNRRAYATAKAKRPKVPDRVNSANSFHRLSGDERPERPSWGLVVIRYRPTNGGTQRCPRRCCRLLYRPTGQPDRR